MKHILQSIRWGSTFDREYDQIQACPECSLVGVHHKLPPSVYGTYAVMCLRKLVLSPDRGTV
jgi:hypothetical protein